MLKFYHLKGSDHPGFTYAVSDPLDLTITGYIRRQLQQVAQFKKMESRKLDENFDYSTVGSLRREAVQKLNLYKPANIGQASRIAGVSPADISVLLVYMEQYGKERH